MLELRPGLALRARRADAVALVTATARWSVSELLEAAAAGARALARADAGAQTAVLLPSSDPAGFLAGLLACRLRGCVAVPWRDGAVPPEAVSQVIGASFILRMDVASREVLLEPLPASPARDPLVGDLVMMTSGSTGEPKGVALELAQVVLNATSAGTAMEVWRCARWCIDIDMSLMSALNHALMAWQFDLPLVHLDGMDPARIAAVVGRDEAGYGGSPIQLMRLKERWPEAVAPAMLVSSGDFLMPSMIDQLVAGWPRARVHKLYGLTELGGRFCCMPHDALLQRKDRVGFPLPGFAARVQVEGPGEEGMIQARTPLRAAGYFHRGRQFEPFVSDWFDTGDIGRMDADGAVSILGRADDVLKVGGEKVDRHTIETALADLMAPNEYCALAVDHGLVGRCVALFVSPKAERVPARSEIIASLRRQLPGRFVPALMYRVDGGLPRLPNGKIDRQALKSGHRGFARLA